MLSVKECKEWLKVYGFECELDEDVEEYIMEVDDKGDGWEYENVEELKNDFILYVSVKRGLI